MSTPLVALSLPNLPQDVIREVIKVGQESIDCMQFVSDVFNFKTRLTMKTLRFWSLNIEFFFKIWVYSQLQVSHDWHDLVIDHFNNRRNLPVIEKLSWKREGELSWRLLITIPMRYRSYFGLESWSELDSDTIDSEDVSEIQVSLNIYDI